MNTAPRAALAEGDDMPKSLAKPSVNVNLVAGLRDALKSASGGRRSTQATRIRNQAAANMVPKSDVTHEAADELEVCQICFYRAIEAALVPCGHQALCMRCANLIAIC